MSRELGINPQTVAKWRKKDRGHCIDEARNGLTAKPARTGAKSSTDVLGHVTRSTLGKRTEVLKMLGRLVAAACLCALATGSAWAVPVNGDFESGSLSPWFQDRAFGAGEFDPWDVTSSDANTGVYSASGTNNTEIRINFDGVQTEDILSVSFFLKHIGSGSAAFVSLFYGDGSQSNTTVDTTTSDWERFDITSSLSSGLTLTGFSIFGNSGGCPGEGCTRTFLDDFVVDTGLSEIPLPAGIPLMLSALGAAAFLRRRAQVSR